MGVVLFKEIKSRLLSKTDLRTRNTFKHVFINLLARGGAILCGFLLVPIMLKYLNAENYGVWLTLNSIVGWLTFCDAGLGNSLKNKLSESLVHSEENLSKAYVSSTYFMLGCGLTFVLLAYSGASIFIDWNNILNSHFLSSEEMGLIAFIAIAFFCGRLLADLIFNILAADQKTGNSSVITFIGSFITLIVVYLMSLFINPSLLYVTIALSAIPTLVSTVASIYYFKGSYASIRPEFKFVNPQYGKSVLKLGARFFIIQLSVLIIFSTDNIIITQLFGPSAVTPYSIAYKFFSIITILWGIILTPYWTAFGNAYVNNDYDWVRKSIKLLTKLWILLMVCTVVMLVISKWVYALWLGESLEIPLELSIGMMLFVIISTLSNLFVIFINSTGKIELQFYSSLIMAILNVPISIFFAKGLNLGPLGIILGTCFSLSLGPILFYIQYKKIITNTDRGIWAK